MESQWTAFERGRELPEGVRREKSERSCFPTQAAKDAAWMGHRQSRSGRTERNMAGPPAYSYW